MPGKGGKKSKGNVNQLQDGHLVHMSVLEVEGFSVLPNTFASLPLVNVMHGKLGDKQQRYEGHAENVMPNLIKAVERGKMNGSRVVWTINMPSERTWQPSKSPDKGHGSIGAIMMHHRMHVDQSKISEGGSAGWICNI